MMRLALLWTVLAIASPALAQDGHVPSASGPPDPSVSSQASSHPQPDAPSADQLPISLDRIRAGLRQAPPAMSRSELRYFVQVYGEAPKIELFTKQELKEGAVPYGAPTHQDFINLWTPEEFRSPPMDLSALVKWINEHLKGR